MTYNQPYLQPYKGRSTRHACPECNVKQSFTLYLNGSTQEPINSIVGKCNRIIKCGYHYTPKQFFQDNPQYSDKRKEAINKNTIIKKPIKENRIHGTIPFSYVEKSASYKSDFIRALCEFFNQEQIKLIGNEYAIGATKNRDVIFWQIDTKGKVRTGKIMKFNPITCKRIHNDNNATDWVHCRMKWQKDLPDDYNLIQCFFGEHLLKKYPNKIVAIVESEKTACIASAIFKELVWLATGGIQGLSVEKCKILQGRNIILFPDLNANTMWEEKAKEIKKQCKCKIEISDLLLKIASEYAINDGSDIADFLIEFIKRTKQNNTSPKLRKIKKNYSKLLNNFITLNPAVQTLIDKLSLEEVN